MKEQLKTAKETNKPSLYIPVCEFFISQLDQKCVLPKDQDTISTGSNLSSEVLKEITVILGLNFDDYSTKSKYIDEKLLKRRNQIAHGQYCIVTSSDYVELHREIIIMLDIFRNQIEISAIEGKFRKV